MDNGIYKRDWIINGIRELNNKYVYKCVILNLYTISIMNNIPR